MKLVENRASERRISTEVNTFNNSVIVQPEKLKVRHTQTYQQSCLKSFFFVVCGNAIPQQ